MKDLLTSALSFQSSFDNHTIIAWVQYTIEEKTESVVVVVPAPSTLDVMKRVFLLNKAGMNITGVKFY